MSSLCVLGVLCVSVVSPGISIIHHRDTGTSEITQRNSGLSTQDSGLSTQDFSACAHPLTVINLLLMDWKNNLIDDRAGIRELLLNTKTIAVLGIKTEAQSHQPAFYVPRYMHAAGFKIIPVPVYYPEVTQILGEPVYRTVADIPVDVDLVNIFRRPNDVSAHVEDVLAKNPKAVWMQSGISNAQAAEKFARAGIKVVQDRCLMVEHRYI